MRDGKSVLERGKMEAVKTELLSAGVSRLSDGMVSNGNVVAFASGKLVVVTDAESDEVLGCVNEHSAPVRSLGMSGNLLLSSDVEGGMLLHRVGEQTKEGEERVQLLDRGQGGSAAVALSGSIAVKAGNDGRVEVAEFAFGKLKDRAGIEMTTAMGESFLPECVAIGDVGTHVIIAVGGSERHVHLLLYKPGESAALIRLGSLLGHRDWIRSVSFVGRDDGSTLLATGSNDRTARIWRLQAVKNRKEEEDLFNPDRVLFEVPKDLQGGTIAGTKEALLPDHTDQVTCVRWGPNGSLATSSMDSSVAVWTSAMDSTWRPEARLGLLGGANSLALGFFSVTITSNFVMASSFSGARFCWKMTSSGDYQSHIVRGGHTAEVFDACWEPQGRFAASCSGDKTVRIWAERSGRWLEVARPQVHGHSVHGIAFVGEEGMEIVTVSEEKMARLFEAPNWFAKELGLEALSTRPDAAEMPALGLSNKPLEGPTPTTATDHSNSISSSATNAEGINVTDTRGVLEEDLMQGKCRSDSLHRSLMDFRSEEEEKGTEHSEHCLRSMS